MVFALEAFSWRKPFLSKPLECASPSHALARLDEAGGARHLWAMGEISVCRDDHNEKRECREKVGLPGIVTVVADFPAHCLCPPCGRIKLMRLRNQSSARGSNALLA